VASRSLISAQRLAHQVRGCAAYEHAQQVADRADIVFVTVTDDAIAPVVQALRLRPGQTIVHCSGAMDIAVLEPARQQGARIGGFHPLHLFTETVMESEGLAGASITLEADEPLNTQLVALARALGGIPLEIPAGVRPLYHAAANYSASLMVCCLYEAVQIWSSFGIDEAATLAALRPLLESTLAATRQNGLAGALAGPVARGDRKVVAQHLQRLAQLGEEHARLYAQLTQRAVKLARLREPAPPNLDEIETLLKPYL
jgi:predicted short-subunit dehydrogenase-like oxidoreductase (DUF2520 family)